MSTESAKPMALVAVMPVGRIMQMGQSVPLVWMDSFFSDDGSCRGMFYVYTFHKVPEIC